MLMRSLLLTGLAGLLVAGGVLAAQSAELRNRNHHRQNRPHAVVRIDIRTDHGRHRQAMHHRRHHRNHGTYSGDIAVFRVRGLGTWSYGFVGREPVRVIEQPSAKIIDVTRAVKSSACAMEAGVCVIRP